MAVALITGAASGIGAATARRLAGPGQHLILHTGSNRVALERQAAVCQAQGAMTTLVVGDLAEPDTVDALRAAARELGHPLHAVVANAGYALDQPLLTLDPERLSDVLQFMVVGLTRLMQATLPMLAAAPSGRFVAVSSFVAHRFNLPGAVYPATASAKAAVEALVKAAAREVAGAGTTVNAVAPGFVRKDKHVEAGVVPAYWQQVAGITPMGRIALPDEIAGVIAFLLGSDAGFVTGQTLHVDGGLTL
nr:SDR family oxidoreductase [Burkholderiaceae bacterium]